MTYNIVCPSCREHTYKELGCKGFYLSVEEGILTATCMLCGFKIPFIPSREAGGFGLGNIQSLATSPSSDESGDKDE